MPYEQEREEEKEQKEPRSDTEYIHASGLTL